ncbi:DUF4082 domain-containing protein [Specibacter sp. NPDC057265]|uniref:DUF4082 domain-containing protein n=1 Tax=Specibacter sp. NPDC057265 TaxID=3346075 RepID=UPI00364314EE
MRHTLAPARRIVRTGSSFRAGHLRVSFTAAAALALLVPLLMTAPNAAFPALAASISVLEDQVPQTLIDPDTAQVELGTTFSSSEDGTVSAVRFYKSVDNLGPHVVKLWSTDGQVLATATLPAAAAGTEGWQSVELPKPVAIAKDQSYIASYIAPAGRYSSENYGLAKSKSNGPLTLHADGGVYAYGDGTQMPSSRYKSTNYFVDVSFTPAPAEDPGTPGRPAAGGLPAGVSVRAVDGGSDYYAKFANALPTTADYFPVAVWYESLTDANDVGLDQAVGLNSYLELTPNSNAALATQAGMPAITTWDAPGRSGALLPDEVDMWAGPGSSAWSGKWPGEGPICVPENSRCGYTIQASQKAAAAPGSMIFANYGKGVTFWETDSEAARFVNEYPNVVSADNYWFTDPNICGVSEGGTLVFPQRVLSQDECRKAANYGWTIDRVRSLVSPAASKPVWAFIEVGHPFSEDDAPTITAAQIKAAVWSSLIHGARGIIYFNHNFGGGCVSQHVLRDACGAQIRPGVTALNAQIKSLAPVLNAPFLDGAATSAGEVELSVRVHEGSLYLFAAATASGSQRVDLSLKCSNATSAAVLGENRSVPVVNGVIADTFADGNAVHLYQLNGSNSCGL